MFETTNGEDEPLKGELTDLTVDHNAGESAGVEGVCRGRAKTVPMFTWSRRVF